MPKIKLEYEEKRFLMQSLVKLAAEMTKEAGYGSIRIDTHEGNIPMRTFLKKQGFEECGIIYLSNEGCVDNKRIAYEKILNK